MDIVRTPDARFADLPAYPFAPHYLDIPDLEGGKLRLHYLDEGPSTAPPVVLMHGEPTWSYLYRKMIPGLIDAGHRVLAPDLIGFGKSDKPTRKSDYSFARHVAWMRSWMDAVDLRGAIFFGQDWGSLIGLTVVTQAEDRFAGAVLANGALPDPMRIERLLEAQQNSPDPEAFGRWQKFAAAADRMDVGALMAEGLASVQPSTGVLLSAGERAAYDAPFPDATYQAGALAFPSLIDPERLGAEGVELFTAAWAVLDQWRKPFVTAYGKKDPVLGWFDTVFQKFVPGAQGQTHHTFADANHFVQEEKAPELVRIIDAMRRAR